MTYSLSRYTSEGARHAGLRARLFTAAALLAIATLAVVATHAAAAIQDSEELTQFGSQGSGAGQLNFPEGVAADPIAGHVYVADSANNRIDEFTPWGNFVKAFGWDVAPGAVSEQQEVRIRASGGQFKLAFGAATTTDLAFNAPGSASEGAGSVEAALNALATIGGAGGSVSVGAVPGTPDGKTPYIYVVAFKGSLAGANVGQLTVVNGTAPLSGGVPSTTLETRTRADGTPGGTGLESCTAESGCQKGLEGTGAGEFSQAAGIAVDAAGNLFVREIANNGGNDRVQKFDSAGRFLLMLGGEVNKTKSAELSSTEAERNRCTKAQLEGGDECGIGTVGAGQGQFGTGFSRAIALSSAGKLFVGDVERIQRFNLEGEYEASVPVSGKTVFFLAVDPKGGNFYAVVGAGGAEQNVRKLDAATGAEIGQLKGSAGQGALAVDAAGNVYAQDGAGVLEFDFEGNPLSPPSCCETALFRIDGLGTNAAGDLYITTLSFPLSEQVIRLFGPGPVMFEAAPRVPPTISAQYATSVDRTGAVLKAEINPHFWSDTRYYVQYGTGKCSEGGCDERPLAPGAILTTKVLNSPVKSAGVVLPGLNLDTTYHYRFVAKSGGGGPVAGEEHTFTTYPPPAPFKSNCQNQVFRTGFSVPLPDCRAFEMVSPVDKNNGDISTLFDVPSFTTALAQSSSNGDRFTYSSFRAFADPKAGAWANQYLASRKDGVGWSSEALDAAQASHLTPSALENHYKAFSADLCSAWLMGAAEPVLASGATLGYNDLYRRDGCGGKSYEALVQVELSGPNGHFYPVLQGASADGKEAIFVTEEKLTEDAASGVLQTYYANNGGLHLICVLPNGSPSGKNCSGGMDLTYVGSEGAPPQANSLERMSSLNHAISTDGSKVYWTDSTAQPSGPGKVYLRLNPGEEQSAVSGGECTEAEKACTVKVSDTLSTKASRFLGASADGSKALIEVAEGAQAGSLYEFDLETLSSTLIAGKGLGVAGASEDLSRVYFASEEAITGTTGASAGEPNLYLREVSEEGGEATFTFIATLSKTDVVDRLIPSNVTAAPIYHAARATADGGALAFISTAPLTGYDNADLNSGEPDSEVYVYEAGAAGPRCVSCNPGGARPVGRLLPGNGNSALSLATAASMAMPENDLYSPHVLSADGKRLFFNSYDALLPRDTNGKEDVYEWEAASGAKDCGELGAELYVSSSGGCLSLISSGESPSDSEFLDSSPNGADVFFATNSSLLPQDPGLVDVYDARANGGLPAPPAPPGPCQGEACQNPPPPPNDPTPASASFKGAGNVTTKPRGRCAKGKARRKGRCVAKKQKQGKKGRYGKRHANHDRGTGR